MKTLKQTISRLTATGFILATATLCAAQSSNKITAEFGTPPGADKNFSIVLSNAPATDIAGFAFKLLYDPSQVDIISVGNNTGQPGAAVQYTLGQQTVVADGGTTAQRILLASTAKEMKGATKLVEINLAKKDGFVAPFKFAVEDRLTGEVIDGLQGADLNNVPHVFDASAVNK